MRKPLDDSGSVEELHLYDEGLGPTSIALPSDVDWVSLTPSEVSAYGELRILLGDLDFAISVLMRLLDDWRSNDITTDIRDVARDDHRARWNAALLAYARTFLSGVGARLDPALFEGDAADLHAFFIRLRNRHVAHSVSDFDRVGVVIGLTRDDPRKVDGLLDYLSAEQSPGKARAEELLKLAGLAREELRGRLVAERKRLMEDARSMVEDLSNRQHITEIPGSRYGGGVRVRRT